MNLPALSFLPIVERELRVAARRPGTYWLRLTAAAAAMGICLWATWSIPAVMPAARRGGALFQSLSWFAFVYAMLTGPRVTADCLSAEKRDGTLGLLFLTDLKGRDVVFGKLAATSLHAFYGLLATLPVLAIPMLMGGVSAGQFWGVALVLVVSLMFSLSAGMLVSSVSRVERKASGGTMLLVLVFTIGPMIAGVICQEALGRDRLGKIFYALSPGYACALANSGVSAAMQSPLWMSLATVAGASVVFLALASFFAQRTWQDRPATVRRLRFREWWKNLARGDVAKRAEVRRRMLAVNPIFWLAGRERHRRAYPWIFLAAMLAVWGWGFRLSHEVMLTGGGLAMSYLANLFLKYYVVTMAAYSFATDRDQGALELLLSTPLTVAEILRGQWLAVRRQFAAPVLAAAGLEFVLLAACALRWQEESNHGELLLVMMMNIAVLIADCWAVVWVGMWAGVKAKKGQDAVSQAVGRVLVPPWLVLLVAILLLVASQSGEGHRALPAIWFVTSLVADVVFARQARTNLMEQLRQAATQRFSSRADGPRWWEKLLGGTASR